MNKRGRSFREGQEFGTGTLYNYFEGKEALYGELVKTFTRAFVDIILPNLEGKGDERQRISRYIRATLGLMAGNAAAVQLYYRQMQALPKAVRDPDGKVSRLRETALAKLAEVFTAGAEAGLFRNLPGRELATCLIGVIEGLGSAGSESIAESSADELAGFVEDLFFQGVLADNERA